MSTDRKMTRGIKGMQRAEDGFTLVELMAVLMIVAVLGLIGTSSLQGLLASFRARSAAREVVTALHLARMKAISRNTLHKVTFGPAGSYQRYRSNAGIWEPEGRVVTLPAGVKFRDDDPTTFKDEEVVFRPTGELTPTTGGTICLKGANDQQKYHITVVGLTGRIKMNKGWGGSSC